jgi:hypothetical protein
MAKQKTKDERDIEILEWRIAEADRLLAEYSRLGIEDEVKFAKLLQKKDKHSKHLKKYKP